MSESVLEDVKELAYVCVCTGIANPIIQQLFSLTADQAAAQLLPSSSGTPLALRFPLQEQRWEENIRLARANGEVRVLRQCTILAPSGHLVDICITPVQNSDMTIITIQPVIATTPLSELELARQELRQYEKSFAVLPIPIWIFDMRGRIRYVNQATLQTFGVTTFVAFTDLVGQSTQEMIARLQPRLTSALTIADATERSISTRALNQLIADGSAEEWASSRRRESAEHATRNDLAITRALARRATLDQVISVVVPGQESELILRTSAAPITTENGRQIGALYLTADATAEMLQHGQRDAMLAIAGHDLRNPLTPARILLQQMKRQLLKTDPEHSQAGTIDRIVDQLDRVQNIADELDAVAATSRGLTYVNGPIFDLVQLCQTIVSQQQQRTPEVPVQLLSNQEKIEGGWSRRNLERVIAMLLANAVRRSPLRKLVTLRLRAMKNQVRIEISDLGEQMTSEQLDALRNVLARGGAALAFPLGGNLDYSVIQTMLGLYRSMLSVHLRGKQGMTFTFFLPLV